MPISLEISLRPANDNELSLNAVERLADDVEAAVMGIGEVVGWDHCGSTGLLIVGGAESDERRLLAIATTHVLAAPEIRAEHVDVVVINGAAELNRRRVRA